MSLSNCPQCSSEHVYEDGLLLICPKCAYEWSPSDSVEEEGLIVLDSNGTRLAGGDGVTIVKNLKIKDTPKDLKQGTCVRSIRLVKGDHNIGCEIDSFGAMELESELVKKL